MDIKNAPIGVFDSGVGGLTVAREIMREIPNEKIIYFGDTARVPYGNKSRETVTKYTRQIIRFLMTHDVKALVIACNTMSANSLDEVEREISIPIIGVVKPGAIAAARETANNRIGVIATEATIGSGMYERFIANTNPSITVYKKACPLFCPLVEEGMLDDPVTDEMAKRYLSDLIGSGIDTLILGCTHYPLLMPAISKITGEKIKLVNPAYETALELKSMLSKRGILCERENRMDNDRHEFYVSDSAEKFRLFASRILNDDSLETSKVDIEEY